MISCTELSKSYPRGVRALDGLTLAFGEGTCGLLGPNGAGKTTFMRILATLVRPSSGQAAVNGVSVRNRRDVRRLIGYLPQDVSFYPQLTALETVEYFGLLSGVRLNRADRLAALERVGLEDAAGRRVGGFSGGMRRRLGVAVALVGDPPVLILDEPTAGLDPEARVEFRSLLASLTGSKTVLLSTHNVNDVEATSRSVAVLFRGRKLWEGAPGDLATLGESAVWEAPIPVAGLAAFRSRHVVTRVVRTGDEALVRFLAQEHDVNNAEPASASVEDGYMWLLNRARQGMATERSA